jgi:hypothetical protein
MVLRAEPEGVLVPDWQLALDSHLVQECSLQEFALNLQLEG